MSTTEENISPVLKGLAFCHKETDEDLEIRFPMIEGLDIEWKYFDIRAEEDKNHIRGSIYDPDKLSSASIKGGYNYIVMPSCPIYFDPKMQLYRMMTPLLAAKCLLASDGILLSNNMMNGLYELANPKWLKAKLFIEENNFELAISLVRKTYPEYNSNNKVNLGNMLYKCLKLKITNLEKNKYQLKKIDKICQNICNFIGFGSYEYVLGKENIIAFKS